MEVFVKIEANAVIVFICIVLFVNSKMRSFKFSHNSALFNTLSLIVSVLLLLDSAFWAFSMIHNSTGALIRNVICYIYYFFNNLTPYLWAKYVYVKVFNKKRPEHSVLVKLPLALSMLLLLLNPFVHGLFRFDSTNTYFTGSMFFLNVSVCYIYMLFSLVLPTVNRHRMGRRNYKLMILFTLPPLLGTIIQFTFQGLNLIWIGSAVSLLTIHLCSLNDKMSLDYLTGLFNRMQTEEYLSSKIKKGAGGQAFSGIMFDIDRFKEINDSFGHHAGDEALEMTARILRKTLKKDAFLSRYGGDEFIAILDIADMDTLRNMVGAISLAFEVFCQTSRKPYKLSLSMGYAVYDSSAAMTKAQFIKHIDRLMYSDKRKKKQSLEFAAAIKQ